MRARPACIRLVVVGACVLAPIGRAAAQVAASPMALHAVPRLDGSPTGPSLTTRPVSAIEDRTRAKAAPWWAPALSALVPGSGQFALGQQRSVAYLVAEAYLLVQGVSARREARQDRDEYRTLAAEVARRPFGGAMPVGPWAYYETMEKYLESGVFDRVAGGEVDPELDESTYNGASWRLARETYWLDPTTPPDKSSEPYQRALAFYTRRAITSEYRWSWRDAQLQQDVYRQTIASANRRFQRSVNMFGLVGANHLASMIDAYVTVRVRRYGGVRVAGLTLDGIENRVGLLGDPADGRRHLTSSVRFAIGSR